MTHTSKFYGFTAAVGLLTLMAGCGSGTPPVSYQVHLTETVPATPQPINLSWQGTLKTPPGTWSRLIQQLGTHRTVSVLSRHPAPFATAMAHDALMWTTAHPQLPSHPLPTVPLTLPHSLAVGSVSAQLSRRWHTTVQLNHHRLPATIVLTATMARGSHGLRQARWTWVINTPARTMHQGQTTYTLPALQWTVRGRIVRS